MANTWVGDNVVVESAVAIVEAKLNSEVDPSKDSRPSCCVAQFNVGEQLCLWLLQSNYVVNEIRIDWICVKPQVQTQPRGSKCEGLSAANISVDLLLLLPIDIGLVSDIEFISDNCICTENSFGCHGMSYRTTRCLFGPVPHSELHLVASFLVREPLRNCVYLSGNGASKCHLDESLHI